jgi:hypothetical protein
MVSRWIRISGFKKVFEQRIRPKVGINSKSGNLIPKRYSINGFKICALTCYFTALISGTLGQAAK